MAVGQLSAFFRRVNQPRGRTTLQRLTSDTAFLLEHPWPAGAELEARLHVFEADGRLFVGRVDVLTVPESFNTPYGRVEAPAIPTLPLGTDLLRMLKLGELTQEAIETVAGDYAAARMVLAEDPAAFQRLAQARVEGGSRRGRETLLTPAVLEVVRSAYNQAGRAPTKAVQAALQDLGFPGSGPTGEVSRDQAAKAVQAARRRGLLPPATGR